MVIIFLSEDDINDGVGVSPLLCRPVSDCGGPYRVQCLSQPCVLEILVRGVKITTTSASIYLMSNVDWLRGGQLLFGVTVNVNKVAVDLGLKLERSIQYLDLDPPAFLHGGIIQRKLWLSCSYQFCILRLSPFPCRGPTSAVPCTVWSASPPWPTWLYRGGISSLSRTENSRRNFCLIHNPITRPVVGMLMGMEVFANLLGLGFPSILVWLRYCQLILCCVMDNIYTDVVSSLERPDLGQDHEGSLHPPD